MNIFVLDYNARLAAQAHVDKHCIKMILESAQLLCGALKMYQVNDDKLYKLSHKNHPSAIWTRTSKDNFVWLSDLALYLGEEYTYRYGKVHKSIEIIKHAQQYISVLPDVGLTNFVQAMPDEYKKTDTVDAYRAYYRFSKTKLLVYTKRKPPEWIKDIAKQNE